MADTYHSLVRQGTLRYAEGASISEGSIDEQGLVLPNINATLEAKIATDINDVHHRILLHSSHEKHILYLPGCYDLVHVGHVSYVQQVIKDYLGKNQHLNRENLYVLILADSDELIEATKGAPNQGKSTRPLQATDIFASIALDFTGHNPRLYDLACLDVDCVGLIPSPTDLGFLLQKGAFRDWFINYSTQEINVSDLNPETKVGRDILHAVNGYLSLIERLKTGQFAEVGMDFHSARRDKDYDPNTGAWNIASWQAFIHKFIASGSASNSCIRIISENDIKYKEVVAGLMEIVGINHIMMRDVEVVSTTTLEEAYGSQELVLTKMNHYLSIRPSI